MSNRWWVYQRERFPLVAHGSLVVVFCVSTLLYSAFQAERTVLPMLSQFLGAIGSAVILFFQLRVADEFKDFEIDSRYRPHRPVPRGLVSLHELAALAIAGAFVQFVIAIAIDFRLVPMLVAVWLYLWLTTREFYVAAWLKAHPVAYLISHMLIMPLLTWYVSAFEWTRAGGEAPQGLGWLLALSFSVGLVMEIGRKIKAPANEREGIETYSGLWGTGRSIAIWIGSVVLSALALGAALSGVAPAPGIVLIVAGLPLLAFAMARPLLRDGRSDRAIEPASGVITLLLYLAAGPLQWLLGG